MIIYQSKTTAPQTDWHQISVIEMAATMQCMNDDGVPITPENLRLHGYSNTDIRKYGLDAARLARQATLPQVAA